MDQKRNRKHFSRTLLAHLQGPCQKKFSALRRMGQFNANLTLRLVSKPNKVDVRGTRVHYLPGNGLHLFPLRVLVTILVFRYFPTSQRPQRNKLESMQSHDRRLRCDLQHVRPHTLNETLCYKLCMTTFIPLSYCCRGQVRMDLRISGAKTLHTLRIS